MKAIAYPIMIGVMFLGVFGLLYIMFDFVLENHVQTFASTNIVDANQTGYQTLYQYAWDGAPVIVTLAFFFFVIVWAQRRSIDEL